MKSLKIQKDQSEAVNRTKKTAKKDKMTNNGLQKQNTTQKSNDCST